MARTIERRLWVMARLSPGGTATPRERAGAEGLQVAAAAALRPGVDWIVPAEGDLALCLALGATPLDVMLAMLGRAADPTSAGRMAPGAFGSRRARILTTSGVAGARVVHAAGIAYASRVRGLDEVTLVSIDERATDTGDWHEGVNFAAVHRLPVICLVLDDRPAAETPGPIESDVLLARSGGYGISGQSLDASDFDSAHSVLARAVERARSGDGPTLVHARVHRLTSLGEDGSFLAREAQEALSHHDPIERMRLRLAEARVVDGPGDEQIQRDCIGVVEAALRQALDSPLPQPARALDNVFAE